MLVTHLLERIAFILKIRSPRNKNSVITYSLTNVKLNLVHKTLVEPSGKTMLKRSLEFLKKLVVVFNRKEICSLMSFFPKEKKSKTHLLLLFRRMFQLYFEF